MTPVRATFAFAALACLAARADAQLTVLQTKPRMNASNVDPAAPIVIEFDRPVDASTLSAIRLHHPSHGPLPLAIALENGGRRVVARMRTPACADSRAVWLSLSHALRAADGSFLRSAGYTTSFSLRAGPARFTFGLSSTFTVSHSGTARLYGGLACDLDGDDFVDLATICENSSDVRVFPNLHDGRAGFEALLGGPVSVGLRPSPNECADLNGDGKLDVVTCNIDGHSVSVLLGNGDGTFLPAVDYAMGTQPRGLALLDADGDGDFDVATANSVSSDVALRLNNGDGTFGAASFVDAGLNGEYGLAVAEMNNDGIPDLAVGARYGGQVALLLGRGDGTFTVHAPYSIPGGVWQIAVGDLDLDRNLDLAMADGFSNTATTLFGDGTGGFSGGIVYTTGGLTTATDLGDLDGDGDLDWVVSCFGTSEWIVYENDGGGHFAVERTIPAPSNPGCASLIDVDDDGDLDIVLLDETSDTVQVWENAPQDHETVCSGDGSSTGCPCNNVADPGHGCGHSQDSGGALLTASGIASVAFDSLALHALRLPLGTSVLFFQGSSLVNGGSGSTFGDGVRCAGGTVIRLGIRVSNLDHSGIGFGVAGDARLSTTGLVATPGGARYYQAWYRNAAAFCTSSVFNLTNAIRVGWTP